MDSQIRLKKQRLYLLNNWNVSHNTYGWVLGSGWVWKQSLYSTLNDGYIIHSTGTTDSLIGVVTANLLEGMRLVISIPNWRYYIGPAVSGNITVKLNGVTCSGVSLTGFNNYFTIDLDSSFNGFNDYNFEIIPSANSNFIYSFSYLEAFNDSFDVILDLSEDIYNITYQVNDIRDISSRNSSFSKKLSIPITKNNQTIWNNVLDINSDTLLNDRYLYKSIDAELLYKTELIEKGFVRLVNINRDTNTFDIEFFGEIANLADACGDDLIFDNEDPSKDVDVSELQHTFNWETINSSWYTLKESGFTYPIIDYSIPDPNASNIFYLKDAKPAIRTKYLFDKILDSVNFKYDSTFLNSAPFTELINPWTGANND